MFSLNPQNSPKWIDSFAYEETNEWPPKLGTIYKNRNQDGKWSEYTITEFDQDKMFVLTSKDGNYHVRYIFNSPDGKSTEVDYHEWVDDGELAEPFQALEKLKSVLES